MTADLVAITPELLVGGLGIVLLVIDLVTGPDEKRLVGWVGIAGLVVALFPSIALLSGAPRLVFSETYAVDPFAAFFKVLAITSGVLVLLAAMEFYRGRATRYQGEVYSLVVFMVLGLMLMAAAADLILLFLAIEFVSLVSYVLAGSLKSDRKSNEAGVKYFFYGAAASAMMLYGFTFLYGASGTTNLYRLAQHVALLSPGFLGLAVMLVLAGLGFKISFVPFHQWTPDVYEGAPTPVTAFLSVGSKAAAFAALLRVFYVAIPPQGWVAIIAGLAAISMTLGNLVALSQQNIKRMLAYSSISHAGVLLTGLVAFGLDPEGPGRTAVLFYLAAYGVTTLGSFGLVSWIGSREHERVLVDDWAGLASRHPAAALGMTLFLLSLAGMPPTAGFFGKFIVFQSAMQVPDNQLLWLVVIGVLNSVLSIFYYLRIVMAMYFREPLGEFKPLRSGGVTFALVTCALLVLQMGLMPSMWLGMAD